MSYNKHYLRENYSGNFNEFDIFLLDSMFLFAKERMNKPDINPKLIQE